MAGPAIVVLAMGGFRSGVDPRVLGHLMKEAGSSVQLIGARRIEEQLIAEHSMARLIGVPVHQSKASCWEQTSGRTQATTEQSMEWAP